MFNAGSRGKRAQDSTGLITVGEHFNQQQYLIPTVTRFAVTDGSYVDTNDTAADTAGNQTIVIYGSGFAPGATILVGSTTIGAVTFLDSGRLTFSSPALGSGSYTIFVTNANGGTGILVPGLVYSGLPTFTTAAGSLGTVYETTAISTSVVATGDAPITYSISSGSLPSGATLSSGGTISGTAPVDGSSTTYSFTVQATDAQNQDSVRSFSLTINTDVVSFSSPANNTTTTATQNTAISNVTVVATSAAGYGVLYTSSGLPTGLSMNTSTGIISGTPTIVASNTSIITATANTTTRTASLYLNWTINLPGDLFWKYASLLMSANTVPNGNTFNTDASTFNNEIIVVADTKPNKFNPFKEGYYSNYFDGTGDDLATANTSAFAFGTGDFTVEGWVYITSAVGSTVGFWQNGAADSCNLERNTSGNLQAWDGTSRISSTTVPSNTWCHVVFCRSGGTAKIFVNGVQAFTWTSSVNYSSSSTWNVGYTAGGTNRMFGYISNVRILKGTALYTAAFTPPTAPLTYVANTSLLTCQSNKLIDNSNNNFTITKTGDTTVNPFSPFDNTPTTVTVPAANNYSIYFDGTGDYLSGPSNYPLITTGPFTIEFWVYQPTLAAKTLIFNAHWDVGHNGGFRLNLSATGAVVFDASTGTYNTYPNVFTSTSTISASTWSHIAIVRNSSDSISCYINGVLARTPVTYASSLSLSSDGNIGQLRIGTGIYDGGAADLFIGYISNLRILNTALYSGNFTPSNSPLGFTQSSSANTAALTALPTNGASVYFDGSSDYLQTPSSLFGLGTIFTVEAWIYPTVLTSGAIVFASTSSGEFSLGYNGTTRFGVSARGVSWLIDSATVPTLNRWNHIVVARGGLGTNQTSLYINGTRVVNATVSSAFTTLSTWQVGYDGGGGGSTWRGYISNLRVVTGTDVYGYTNTTITSPTAPLTTISTTNLLTCQSYSSSNNRVIIDNSTNAYTISSVGDSIGKTLSPFANTPSILMAQANTLIDSSNNGITFTVSGDARPARNGPFANTSTVTLVGNEGSAYFDGTGDYLDTPSANTSGIFAFGTADYTLEGWIYPTATTASMRVFEFSGNQDNIGINQTSTGTIDYYNGSASTTSAAGLVVVNTWTHIALVRQSGTAKVYVNGALAVTQASTPNTTVRALWIGGRNNTVFQGYMSNVRATKGTALYTTPFVPTWAPLTPVANTVLLTAQTNLSSNTKVIVDESNLAGVVSGFGNSNLGSFSPFGGTWSNYFDGTGDWLSMPSSTIFEFGTGDFTIECWAYPISFGNGFTLYAHWNNSGPAARFAFAITATGIVVDTTSGMALTFSGTTTITVGQWYHVAVTRTGSSWRTFINGTIISTATSSSTYSPTGMPVYIGDYPSDFSTGYGYISNLRVLKGTALYTANTTITSSPLVPVANTVLLTCNSNQLVDYSAANNVITRTGDTAVSKFSPFSSVTVTPASYSGYFDGTGDYLTVPSNAAFSIGTGDYTVEAWLYLTGSATNMSFFGGGVTGTPVFNIGLTRTTISINPYGTGPVNGTQGCVQSFNFNLNTWYHVAITRASGTTKIFLNGTQLGTNVNDPYGYVQGAMGIGALGDGIQPFTGYISNLRYVKGTALYTGNFTVPTTPLGLSQSSGTNITSLGIPANGSSVYFDGSGDYLSVPSNAALQFGTGDFTIEGWIYQTAFSGDTPITASYQTWATSVNFYFATRAGSPNVLVFRAGDSLPISLIGNTSIPINTWTHVAVARSSGVTKIFVNGTEQTATHTGSVNISATALATGIGASQGGLEPFTGYISNLRFIKGTAVYTATFTPPTAPLTAIANTVLLTCQNSTPSNTRIIIDSSTNSFSISSVGDTVISRIVSPFGNTAALLTCQSTSFIDTSNNAFAITVNGDAKPVIQNPFTDTISTASNYSANTFGSSVYFDGTTDYLTIPYNPGFNIPASTPFTFECWVYTTSTAFFVVANRNWSFGSSGPTYAFQLDNGTTPGWSIAGTGSATYSMMTAGIPGKLGQWNHYAWTRDSSNVCRIFTNGVEAVSSTRTDSQALTSASGSMFIGVSSNLASSYANGYLSNLRFVVGSCTYTRAFVPPNQPLPVTSNATMLLASTVGPSTADATRNHNIETFGTARQVANNSPYYDTYSGYFDGTGDYLTFGANQANLGLGTGDFTFEFWFNAATIPSTEIDIFESQTNNSLRILKRGSSAGLSFDPYGGTATLIMADASITTNTWHHVAVSRTSGTTSAYYDGTRVVNQADSTNYATPTANYGVGGRASGANYLNGYISNMRLIKGTGLYSGTTITVPTGPLTAVTNTQLLICNTNKFVDGSNNAFTITKAGDAKITTLQPFAANNTSRFNSVYFPTKTDYLAVRLQPSLITFPGDFTFECWVYPTDTTISTTWGIWDSRQAGATSVAMIFGLAALASPVTGSWRLTYYNGTQYYGTGTVLWNQWTHVAWARSGTTMTFYVNGVAGGTATISGTQTGNATTAPIYIGSKDNGLANYGTVGYIADFRITNGYARTITVPTAPYDIK
jgi:hypothetical protein